MLNVSRDLDGNSPDAIDFESLSYDEILKAGKLKYYSFKTVKEEYLALLIPKRKELLGRGGEGMWTKFVRDLNGPCLKTLNSHLDLFEANGNKKPDRLTVKTVFDPNKVVVRNVKRDRDAISFDVFLPEFNVTHHRVIRA